MQLGSALRWGLTSLLALSWLMLAPSFATGVAVGDPEPEMEHPVAGDQAEVLGPPGLPGPLPFWQMAHVPAQVARCDHAPEICARAMSPGPPAIISTRKRPHFPPLP